MIVVFSQYLASCWHVTKCPSHEGSGFKVTHQRIEISTSPCQFTSSFSLLLSTHFIGFFPPTESPIFMMRCFFLQCLEFHSMHLLPNIPKLFFFFYIDFHWALLFSLPLNPPQGHPTPSLLRGHLFAKVLFYCCEDTPWWRQFIGEYAYWEIAVRGA